MAPGGDTPPTTVDGGPESTITTPTAGRLFVMYLGNLTVDCSTGDGTLGLYVDGVPVPRTQRFFDDEVTEVFNVFGLTAASVPAGSHTLRLGINCSTGNFSAGSYGARSFGTILIGS